MDLSSAFQPLPFKVDFVQIQEGHENNKQDRQPLTRLPGKT